VHYRRSLLFGRIIREPSLCPLLNARVGGLVPLPVDLLDMGLPSDVYGTVTSNEPCPTITAGPGRLVLTTVSHLNRDVRELALQGASGSEVVRPTGLHKFYREHSGEWVSAQDLLPGEILRGKFGPVTVTGNLALPGVHRVYNLTVEGEHTYEVSNLGVVVHNNGCAVVQPAPAIGRVQSPAEAWQAIDRFRSHTRGLPPLGDRVPVPRDGLGTVALVDLRGRLYFGVNSSELSEASKDLGRQVFGLMRSKGLWEGAGSIPRWYGDGAAQVLTHAEAHALMRAWASNGGTLPKEITLYVDRYTCGNCQQYIPRVMKALGIEKLTIIPKNGQTIPPFIAN